MIHYMYTGELVRDLQDLDILDMVMAADMYDLPGWVKLLGQSTNMTGEIVADLIIAGSKHEKFKHLKTDAAIWILRGDSLLSSEKGFVEKLRQHDSVVMIELMKVLFQEIQVLADSLKEAEERNKEGTNICPCCQIKQQERHEAYLANPWPMNW